MLDARAHDIQHADEFGRLLRTKSTFTAKTLIHHADKPLVMVRWSSPGLRTTDSHRTSKSKQISPLSLAQLKPVPIPDS